MMARERPGGRAREKRMTAHLERLANRTAGRLALLLGFAVALWLLTALAARALHAYPSYGEALWSGIRHLLDPGSLGDDAGDAQRAVGLVQVLTGIVLVVGLALTVLSELVDRTVRRIGEIDPPVAAEGHLLVIGDGEALPTILAQLAESDPGARAVVLVPPGPGERRRELQRELAAATPSLRLSVVSGDASEAAGLARASARTAGAIVILSPPAADDDASDVLAIAIAARLAGVLGDAGRAPHVGAEIRRGRNADSVWELFPPNFDAVVRDRSMGTVLGLAMENPSFAEILGSASRGPGDPRPFAIEADRRLAGADFAALPQRLVGGLPIGLLQRDDAERVRLVPEAGTPVGAGDRVIVLAGSEREVRLRPAQPAPAAGSVLIGDPLPRPRPLLVGWSPTAAGYVEASAELADPGAPIEITVLAPDDPGPGPGPVRIRWRRGDPRDPGTLGDALAAVSPDIALIASVPGPGDPRVADARAALAALHLCRAAGERRLVLLVEQRDGERAAGLEQADARIRIVSAAAVAGQTIALAATDPHALAAREAMVAPGIRLERRELLGAGPAAGRSVDPASAQTTLAVVHRELLAQGATPIAAARDGIALDLLAPVPLQPGDELLVLHRTGPPDATGP